MLSVAGLMVAALALSGTSSVAPPKPDGRVIDLNTATVEELLAFDGIGRLYAEKIVRARPFRARSELVDRHVMPTSAYLAIKHRLYTSAAQTGAESRALEPIPAGMFDLNQASRGDLLGIPGVGQQYADKIIAGRPYRTEAELVSRRIVPLATFERVQSYLAVQR